MSEQIQRVTDLPRLPRRRADGHKGDYGRVLLVGGSRGMPGAVALAANAALRGGAGLVTFAAPEPIQLTIAALCPCATSLPLACDAAGEPTADAVEQLTRAAAACDVLAVGPGLSVGPHRRRLVEAAIDQPKCVVVDADGLNNLANMPDWPARATGPLVLTPHPGEFARLTGAAVRDIQADRVAAAVEAVRRWAARAGDGPKMVCVLKGAGTVVTDGRRVYVNPSGNPGMATGGSGDVLTGLLAALLAQGLAAFEASCLAAHVHGRAGDLAAETLGQPSVIATDLLTYLPAAMKEACG